MTELLSRLAVTLVGLAVVATLVAMVGAPSQVEAQQEMVEFEVVTFGIETGTISPTGEKDGSTDFEVQWFADFTGVASWALRGPHGELAFSSELAGSNREQGGSELTFASQPNHPYDPDTYPGETLDSFLERFPEGEYVFTGLTKDGAALESIAHLTHHLPAHPEVRVHVSENGVRFSWKPVTGCFDETPCDAVNIVEYSVKVEEDDIEREDFVDGGFTNGASRYQEIHYLPDIVCGERRCKVDIGGDFFVPGNTYGWQVFAIEQSGNSTYRADTFVFPDDEVGKTSTGVPPR